MRTLSGDSFKAIKITNTVYWVGAIDWNIRDFHGYSTSRGTTYNAFLIMADKITLIDTVKASFKDELLARIESIIDPKKIDYIISNHAEMDHSGCLPEIIREVKPEKVFASKMGVKALKEHFDNDKKIAKINAVDDNGSLDLGNMTMKFMETRLLHWPDSMFSYLVEEKLLFSQDGFGMHLASTERFADELPEELLYFEASKYYANILLLYSDRIQKLLSKVEESGMEINILAPDHGPVWTKGIGQIIDYYKEWSSQKKKKKAVIAFDTMWGSTDKMARAIAEGVSSLGGIKVKVLSLAENHRSDVITEVLDAAALIIGSPTMNNNMFPTIADLLCYIKGLKPKKLIGAAFGSFGWSGESVKQVEESLTNIGVDLISAGIRSKYIPDSVTLKSCYNFGIEIAKKILSSFQEE